MAMDKPLLKCYDNKTMALKDLQDLLVTKN